MSIVYNNEIDESSLQNFSKKLMCVEYPGMVTNVDKMINTLGGLDNIGIAYSTKNRRVELRFRPDDIYCKPTCGDKQSTTALLLKIKVKKKSRNIDVPCSSKDADSPEVVTFTTSVVGVVDTIYKFNSLCDFQYLPMSTKKGEPSGGKLENIYDKLRPNILPSMPWLHDDSASLFLTPPVFSRFDTVHYYNAQKIKDTTNLESQLIGRTRKRRTGYAIFVTEKDKIVPKKPFPESLKMLQVKFLNKEPYEKIKQLFEERPVWSKNALTFHTNFSKDQLKFLLPTVAYYFTTGPWRVMWIRYDYDPRQDPASRIYQTFDYRLRTVGGMRNQIKAKRSYSNCLLPYKNSPASRPKIPIISRHSIAKVYQAAVENPAEQKHDENSYIFRPGMIPPFRQMFYQYCDIQVPEVQSMLARLPQPESLSAYDSRTGWLPADFNTRCREIISSLVTAEIRKKMFEEQRIKQQTQTAQMIDEQREQIPDDTTTTTSTNSLPITPTDRDSLKVDYPSSQEIEISDSDSEIDFMDALMDDDDSDDESIDSDLEEASVQK